MIYLDNAATTFPKPPCVAEEIKRCMNTYCGNPGRSGHYLSIKAAEKVFECRESLSSFFGSPYPENVVFTVNTTHALNVAIKSLYKPNTHILMSNMEHNSVLRPVHALKNKGEITYSFFNVMQSTANIIFELEKKIRNNTSMLIMTHASNICGRVFPIKEIGCFCRKHNITFVVDAAQSAGIAEINMEDCKIDALCVPAHKGLYGPQGLGFVIFGSKKPLRTIIEGGNGANSLSAEMGLDLPESFEAGTISTPLIAGLDASVKWVNKIGIQSICNHEIVLSNLLYERLSSIKGSIFYGAEKSESGILLYNNSKIPPDILSKTLDKKGICTRSGFHCTPLAHNTLETTKHGALRFSFSFFNTKKEIDEVYKTIKVI